MIDLFDNILQLKITKTTYLSQRKLPNGFIKDYKSNSQFEFKLKKWLLHMEIS